MHCLSMEDRKAAIEDMETTLYKVRNIIGSIRYSELLYLKNTKTPKVREIILSHTLISYRRKKIEFYTILR